MLPTASIYGNVSAYSHAVHYVVVFVWVGIAQPPRTSLWVSPLAVVAHLVPFFVEEPPPTAIASVTVAIPVCVPVGEVLARQVARRERSRSAAVRRGEHEQAVVDALADGVLVVGEDGRVISCNQAATTLLSVPAPAPPGTPPTHGRSTCRRRSRAPSRPTTASRPATRLEVDLPDTPRSATRRACGTSSGGWSRTP